MQLENMYQEIILDHYKNPHGRGLREPFEAEVHHVNPTCGDEVTLRVTLGQGAGVPVVDGVSWEGQGCSISQASVSVLTDLVTGADLGQVDEISETFRALMHARGAGLDEEREEALGDATAFTGVAKYPARIKCALLGWAALRDAIVKSGAVVPSASTRIASTTTAVAPAAGPVLTSPSHHQEQA